MTAPATAIFAYDLKFYDQMPKLSPTNPTSRESWMQKPQAEIEEAAFRSGTLQAGYFMLAARAVGLDEHEVRLRLLGQGGDLYATFLKATKVTTGKPIAEVFSEYVKRVGAAGLEPPAPFVPKRLIALLPR